MPGAPSPLTRRLFAGAALALFISGCGGADKAPAPPRLVLLFVPCTVNLNYLSPYNPEVAYTPHLQKFADRSLTFRRHHTEAGTSGIAFASIFTGTQAPHHRIYYHPNRIPDEVEDISEVFAALGYDTLAPKLLAFSHSSLIPPLGTRNPAWRGSRLQKLFPDSDPELMWIALRDGDMLYQLRRSEEGAAIGPAAYDLRGNRGAIDAPSIARIPSISRC